VSWSRHSDDGSVTQFHWYLARRNTMPPNIALLNAKKKIDKKKIDKTAG
jgi:hypothetical protein